jgi:opacity protein-like surface antigen
VAAASTGTPAHAVKTILVEVHRVANFNLMGGVMLIHIPTAGYSLQASPTPAVASTTTPTTYTGTCAGQTTQLPAPASGTNPPAYSCVVQTQQTQWQISGMAGVVWFPWGHDYFPRHSGYANFGRNLLPSLLIATSVSSLGNSMGGVNWEPASGMDFYAGIGSAHRTVLPSGLSVNTALPSGAGITQITQEHAGFTVGVGFDLSVITSLFSSKSTSVATMP